MIDNTLLLPLPKCEGGNTCAENWADTRIEVWCYPCQEYAKHLALRAAALDAAPRPAEMDIARAYWPKEWKLRQRKAV